MIPRSPQLTIDHAMGEIQAVLKEQLGDNPPRTAMAPETPEEAEVRRFRFAEYMLGLACPDPAGAEAARYAIWVYIVVRTIRGGAPPCAHACCALSRQSA